MSLTQPVKCLYNPAWLIETLLTELIIALVVHMRQAFFSNRSGKYLLVIPMIFIGITSIMPTFRSY